MHRTVTDRADAAFARLRSLQGSDPGFYVLAVHSFIEQAIRSRLCQEESDVNFKTLIQEFHDHLLDAYQGRYIAGLNSLQQIKNQHFITNGVRHRFQAASPEDARAATQHLSRFCELAGIPPSSALSALLDDLKAWDDRRSRVDLVKELNELGYRYHVERRNGREAMERLAALQRIEAEAEHLKEALRAKERELARLEERREAKDAKVDELRRRLYEEKAALSSELKAARAKAGELDDARRYIELLTRLTVLTRTRADYERSVIRLSAEQRQVLGQIRLDKDFLVKGAAGTGKTLVLLKAIEKAKGRGLGQAGAQDELGLRELQGSVALLTYTATLVKYDRYLSSIMIKGWLDEGDRIVTVDSFMLERLKALEPDAGIDMDGSLLLELAALYAPSWMEPKALAAEAEGFLWANGATAAEYLDGMMERRGMRSALQKPERLAAWTAAECMSLEMESRARYSRNYAALKLSRALDSGEAAPCVDYVFLDEAQDLSASVLRAVRLCARRCLVLAGDADQSIYQPGFSFSRAGLDIVGRTRVLRTNFRNTVSLHELAERYRRGGAGGDEESQPLAFRDGPAPELFQGPDRQALADALAARIRLFTGPLGYEPDNLCVLAPRKDDLAFLRERLAADGITLADIRALDFDFSASGSVRATTLHSAKGLDFPVVFLFLSRPPYFGEAYDEAATERLARNLIYVALTRAMDHLDVFTLDSPQSPAVRELVAAFRESGSDRDRS